MSKRLQETQGGDERYGGGASAQASMADQPTQATAAQMARRKIAQTRKASGSQRSSRANTPTANPFGQPQQQSMPSFQPPAQSSSGFGGGFNFTAGADSNPFAQPSQTGTPPPTAFQFGAPPSQPPAQQNGSSGIFGNNTSSFGSTFGSNTAQPQQNGFNPSTSTAFGNQANTPSFGFGQGNQSQQNGATPSSNGSFPTFGAQTENPFKNFGQSQQTQSTPSTSFGGFNSQPNGEQTKPQTNGTQSLFNTETPKSTTNSMFGSFGQPQNENKTPFASTAPSQQNAPATTTGLFSGQSQSSTPKPLFGSTATTEQASSANGSVFLGLDSGRASTVKPGMFTSGNNTPKSSTASNPFTFGQQKDTSSQPQETPKASSLFSNLNQNETNGDKASMFGGNAATDQTPKPANSLFNFGQSQQNTATMGFKSGQTESRGDDASMTTPGNTPQKPSLFSNSSSQETSAANAPATQGKSLFDRVSNGPASTTPNAPATPSTSLFNPQVATGTATPAQPSQTPATQAGNLFDRTSRDDSSATTIKQTSFTPSTNLFSKGPGAAAATPSAAPWLSHTPAALQTTVTPPTPQRQTTTSTTGTQQPAPPSTKGNLKKLNEGLLRHLQNEDSTNDWSTIMKYYLEEASKIDQPARTNSSTASSSQSHIAKTSQSQPSAVGSSSNWSGSTFPKTSGPGNSNMFANSASQQTPKSTSLFANHPPATEPVNKKRPAPFEEDDGDAEERPAPATEKRAKPDAAINYPSLPENASSTSRLFQAALDKSTSNSAAPASSGFIPPSSSGGFKPTASSVGPPSFGAPASGGSGFLASFGKRANAEEEKQKKKRKAEDYDSDEETEEQWEAKDRAEQEAKKKKIEDAAKTGSGFSVSRSVTPVPPPETPAAGGKSLFERISKEPPATAPSKPSSSSMTPASGNGVTNFFGSKTPAATSSASLFAAQTTAQKGEAASANGNRPETAGEHEDGDNTWKPNTPIKFGAPSTESTTPAAAPPKFGNLFGEPKTAITSGNNANMLNIPSSKPNLGFNFGGQPSSLSNSRATTPGVTTDGEGASTAGEEEEPAQVDPQMEDQSALHPKEREEHTVLFEVAMAKASKIDEKRDAESGEVSKGWVEKGKGPLYILKHKQTDKVSVLMKIKPLGRAAMNFSVQAKMRFDVVGSSGKQVQGAFVDTLADKNANQMSRWMVAVGKAEAAQELAKVLNEAAGVV